MSLVKFFRLFSCGIAEDRVNSENEKEKGVKNHTHTPPEPQEALEGGAFSLSQSSSSDSLSPNLSLIFQDNDALSYLSFEIEDSYGLDPKQIKKGLLLKFPSLIQINDQEEKVANLLGLTPYQVEQEVLKIGRGFNLALNQNNEELYLIEKNERSGQLEIKDVLAKIFLRPKLEALLIFCENLTSLTLKKGLKKDLSEFESSSFALENLDLLGDSFLGQKFSTVPFLTSIFQDACKNERKSSYVLVLLELIVLEFKVYLKASIFLHLAQEKEVGVLQKKLENIFFIEEAKNRLKSKEISFKDFFLLLQSL